MGKSHDPERGANYAGSHSNDTTLCNADAVGKGGLSRKAARQDVG